VRSAGTWTVIGEMTSWSGMVAFRGVVEDDRALDGLSIVLHHTAQPAISRPYLTLEHLSRITESLTL